jgi:hypothetical protein
MTPDSTQSGKHMYCTSEPEPELTEDGELLYVDYLLSPNERNSAS